MATTTVTPRASTYRSRSWIYEWLTTTDHKKIGIMYITTAYIFFLLAGLMALGIRTELAFPGTQILEPDVYNQAFTMHGTTMIFFFVMPMLAGFANYVVPLQIGAATWPPTHQRALVLDHPLGRPALQQPRWVAR
jgi:cytochrome c oxidase subunit 1